MVNITVRASVAWQYFQINREMLKHKVVSIAKNDEYGVDICITEEGGLPSFIVTADGYQYADAYAKSEKECEEVLKDLYDKYLTGKFLDDEDISDFENSLMSQEDKIYERETELDDAVLYLMNIATSETGEDMLGFEFNDDICEDVKDHILEYIARKHNLPVYRPMMLEDEDGEDFYEEYPYECMVFEDEDNPIYKPTGSSD